MAHAQTQWHGLDDLPGHSAAAPGWRHQLPQFPDTKPQSGLVGAGLFAPQPFICTLLLSRRLYPQAPNHKLGSLVDYHRLPRTGQAHRALADAEMAAELFSQIQRDLQFEHGVASADHALLLVLQRCAKSAVAALLARHVAANPSRLRKEYV